MLFIKKKGLSNFIQLTNKEFQKLLSNLYKKIWDQIKVQWIVNQKLKVII